MPERALGQAEEGLGVVHQKVFARRTLCRTLAE